MATITTLITIATNEVGYLEKKSLSNLDSKTENAGSNNYTKYWRDIKPSFQGEPWCACFVTWCFVQAFGKDVAKTLLKQYPYVYCPSMSSLFILQKTPQIGDIIMFTNGKRLCHTGIVYKVDNSKVYTIEGNTSAGNTMIENGGGVAKKSYSLSYSKIAGYVRPDYSILKTETKNEEELTMAQYEELKNMINELNVNVANLTKKVESNEHKVYNWIVEIPEYYQKSVEKFYNKGILKGDENGALNLSEDMCRFITILDRALSSEE